MALDPLAAIRQFESGGRNILQQAVGPNGGFNPSTGTVTGPSTAQGYYQITNTTWSGIPSDITQGYPNAMSAPPQVQTAAAAYLYNTQGFAPWAPYNSNLNNYINQQGGASAFASPGSLSTNANDYNTVDPTANIGTADTQTLDQNTFGFDPTIGNTVDANGNPTLAGISPDTTQVASGDGTVTGASNGLTLGPTLGQSLPSGNLTIGSGGLTYVPSSPEQAGKAPPATTSIDIPDVGAAIQGGFSGVTAQIGAYANKTLNSLEEYLGNFALRGGVMIFAVIIFLAAAWLMVPRESKMQIVKAAAS